MTEPDKDLFGEPIGSPVPPPPGTDKRRVTQPKGYAAPPGTGPQGETCKTCEHYVRRDGSAKKYLKCALVRARWTNGPGTDIKAGSPACLYWEEAKK